MVVPMGIQQANVPQQGGPAANPGGLTPEMQQDIIAYCKYQFESYHRSYAFQNWRRQAEAISDAVEQRYRTAEQVTRSGFYLAALRAEYDGLKEGATNIFAKANPLFIYRKKPGFQQDTVDKIQQHVNDEWDNMSGMDKYQEVLDDTWIFGTGITYTKWQSVQKYGQFPVVVPQVWGGTMIDWQEGFQTIANGPELERVHPLNWAGDYRRSRDLAWEGCMREWRISEVQRLQGDRMYLQDGVGTLLASMRDKKSTTDPYFYHPDNASGGLPYQTSPRAIVYEYWGDLTGVKGFESDPHEYVVMWADTSLLRFNYNPIYIGGEQFRPFTRTRASVFNSFPQGRSPLAPNLTHQKLQNLMVNLSIDDILIRQHLGIALWADQLENPNDILNPEGARGFVWMKNNANPNLLPRLIGEGSSGIMRDSMDFMDRIIKPDQQKSGRSDTAQGLKEGAQNGTATAAQLMASIGNRRDSAGIAMICKTGLRPIARHLTLLTLRNRTMQDLQQFSNEELLGILQNNQWEEHDSITQDPYQASMNKAEFYNMAKDVMMQVVAANGDASHVVEFLRDIARDKGIKPDDFDRYFPLAKPADASAPAGGPPQPAQPQLGNMPGAPEQPTPPPASPAQAMPPPPPAPPAYTRQPQGPPPAPSDPIRVSLALKGEDMHDPLVIAMLKSSGAIPPDAADHMTALSQAMPPVPEEAPSA